MTLRWTWAPVLVCALLAACNIDLDRAPLVGSPRILAIVADPPEPAPGEDVHVRVLAVDPGVPPHVAPRALHYTFRLCVDPASFFGGFTPDGSNGVAPPTVFCYAPVASRDNTYTIPGGRTQMIADALPQYAGLAGLVPQAVEDALATVGIPLQIRVAVSAIDPTSGTDTTLVSGVKLIGLTTRAHRTTNPPYVYFSIGDSIYLGGLPNDSFECHLWSSAPVRVIASISDASTACTSNGDLPPDEWTNDLLLTPLDDPFDWMETYPFYDYAQTLHTAREGAYYSWYTTSDFTNTDVNPHGCHCVHQRCHTIHEGGDTTQVSATAMESDPDALMHRATSWDIPSTPGTYDLWLVVRDGHLGESACHTTIEVVGAIP
jgi:hypothetical protein